MYNSKVNEMCCRLNVIKIRDIDECKYANNSQHQLRDIRHFNNKYVLYIDMFILENKIMIVNNIISA